MNKNDNVLSASNRIMKLCWTELPPLNRDLANATIPIKAMIQVAKARS
jgi:hypothetical protein